MAKTRDEPDDRARSGRRELEPVKAGPNGENGTRVPDSPHASPAAGILAALGVSPDAGLDEAQVRMRQAAFGRNALDLQPPKSAAVILLHQLQSPVVALLGAAAALSGSFGDWRETVAILVVLGLNTLIGFVTELKAERSMGALRRIGAHLQRVRRNGQVLMVDSEELVPGDIMLVEAGDVATADARLVRSANLSVDESALTGESVPVEKSPAPAARDAAIGDRSSMLHKGTAVTRGSAIAVVTATGMGTELGRVARLAASAAPEDSPLTKSLGRLSRHLIVVTLLIAAVVASIGILRGQSPMLMVEAAIALAVAAIPEGLPIVATLALARGMWRMARKNALIERLSAVETLGATTVILTDKTGTLTENRMTVERIVTAAGDTLVHGRETQATSALPGLALRLLRAAALCSDAVLKAGRQPDTGDPLELALLRAADRAGLTRARLLRDCPEVERQPFDSDTRMMVTVHRCGGAFLVAAKGAPEAILARAARLAGPDGDLPLDRERRERLQAKVEELGRQGLRVLAVAECTIPTPAARYCGDLTLLGLVGLHDPPRHDVEEAIAACQGAGIRVVMVTGDHAVTAASIARSVCLGSDPQVIEGHALANGSQLSAADIRHADVLARVSPSQKLDLVSAYQTAGEVVAMTGDGVNDAPALRKADIGVAMGQRGTEVARQAAAMVLRDDSFATIVAAIREGRVIFANIRRFVLYLLACNLSEVMVVGIAVAAGLPLPLLPLQILFLNLVTDVFPAFALAMSEGGGDVMRRPPRDPKEPIVTGPLWTLVAAQGLAMTLATLAAMALARDGLGLGDDAVVTVSFLTLALAQIWHTFNMADPGQPLIVNDVARNPYVWGAVLICLALIGIACYVRPLAEVLKLTPPDARAWVIVSATSLCAMILGRAVVAGLGWFTPSGRGLRVPAAARRSRS
jgi:Ca2+-transporting ATPase